MSHHLVVLLLGSNLGNSTNNINEALGYLDDEVGEIFKKSDYIKTEPVEYESHNIFCNIAVSLNTSLSPSKLLIKLKEIERRMGRNVDSAALGQYSDRIIDIDIVYYDGITFKSKTLLIPHLKHIKERDFSQKLISQLNDI